MAGLISSRQWDFPATGRIGRALAASACVHLWVAAMWQPGIPERPAPAGTPPISAWIVAPVETTGVEGRATGSVAGLTGAGDTKRAPSPAAEAIYYPAGELDVFPRLLTPLGLERVGNAAGGAGIRATVRIDEAGAVKAIEVTAPGRRAEEELRAVLAVARFAPALRDGRPVRSRIVLDLRFATSDY